MEKQAIIKALRDGVQATSNGIANSVLSGPVDGIAAGLEYLGVPVGSAPMGGSQWMQNNGITRPIQDGGAPAFVGDLVGQTIGNVGFGIGQMAALPKAMK